jgi:hypothetical protein
MVRFGFGQFGPEQKDGILFFSRYPCEDYQQD